MVPSPIWAYNRIIKSMREGGNRTKALPYGRNTSSASSKKALIVMCYLSPVRRLALSGKLLCLGAAVFIRMLLMLPNLVSAARSLAIQTGKVRIIYTNDTIGYLEPCGCGGRYQGGLARRATVIARLVKENPNTLLVDSGNLADKASKLPLVAKLMGDMHYDAVDIEEIDSSFGDDYSKTALSNFWCTRDWSKAGLRIDFFGSRGRL